MAIAIVGTATADEADSATSITPTMPTGVTDGDIVIIWVTVPGTTPSQHSGTPSGWTQLVAPVYVTDNNIASAYYRFKSSSWSTMPTISTTASASRTGSTCSAYRGVDTSTPIDTSVVFDQAAAASIVLSSLTASIAGTQLVTGGMLDSSSTLFSPTSPTGTTLRATTTGSTPIAGRGISLADEYRSASGATGTRTWGTGGTIRIAAFMLLLRPSTYPQMAGTAASVSSASGGVTARLLAVGTAAANAASTSGSITSKGYVTGTVAAATSTVTGVVILTPPPISGHAAATSSASGDGVVKVGFLAVVSTAATISGTLGPFRLGLSGVAQATSTPHGSLTQRALAQGRASSTSGAVGTIANLRLGVSGRMSTSSSDAGTLTSILAVSGVSSSYSGSTGGLLVTGKPGQGSEVLVLFNPDEVLTGGRVTYYQFDLLDQDENLIGQLRGVDNGSVSFDAYSSVKSTGKLTVRSDPEFSYTRDNQPDFLGVQINTPTGIQAPSAVEVTQPVDHFVCLDSEALEISVGDRVILTDSASQPKESTAFTVRLKESSDGYTTVWFTTSAIDTIEVGDLLKVVTVSFQQRVDWLTARIRPMVSISRLGGGDDPQGRLTPVGVFLCAAPVEQWGTDGLTRDIELVDKLSILDQDIANGDPNGVAAYALDAGANIIDAVKALIEETGESTQAIEPNAATLTDPLVWEIGTTRLKVINNLLDAAGYFSLFCDGNGQYMAVPYTQPADRVPVYESIAPFSDGHQSLMDPSWTRDRDIYAIPNRYLVVGQGSGDVPALTAIATNEDASSPYSYQARGRWVTTVEVGVEAASQSELDTIARSRLSRATSVTNQLSVKHAYLPDLRINSVVRFVNPGSELDTYCYVVKTEIPFDPVGLCSTVMRLVS